MPRNSSGIYSLPPGNPVIPDTIIESTWANTTMTDISVALTNSLPRDGSASMTGPLTLAGNATLPLQAVPFQQLNSSLNSNSNYLPAGAIQAFAMIAIPTGWLLADGSAVSRTTYANLFANIGTTYGAGNGTTTFNLPDLRGEFIRGFDAGRNKDPGRAFGSVQAASNQLHNHGVTLNDPGHVHGLADPGHVHGVNDPGHTHNARAFLTGTGVNPAEAPYSSFGQIPAALTGISIQGAYTGASVQAHTTNATVTAASEGTEARPTNVAMAYCIKAFGGLQQDGLGTMAFQNSTDVHISGGVGVFDRLQCLTAPVVPTDVARLADIGGSVAEIFSSDPQVLFVDNTTPATPILRPQTNMPNGMCKLDAGGYIPASVLNITDLTFLGTWDASLGLLPVGTFVTGDYYIIDVAGTLTLNTSAGRVAQLCNIGDQIIYKVAPTTGWWYSPAAVSSDSVTQTSPTGAANLPAGTTAERPGTPLNGQFRYNTTTAVFEGYTPNGWGQVGGGQMYGTAPNKAIFYNNQLIAEDLTVLAGSNGGSFGPVTVNNGNTVTVESGSVWSIV